MTGKKDKTAEVSNENNAHQAQVENLSNIMITVISVTKWGTTTLSDRRGHMNEIDAFLLT